MSYNDQTNVSQVHTSAPNPATPTQRGSGAPSVPFVFTGTLSVTTSPFIVPRYDMVVTGMSLNLGSVGTTATTVAIVVNGAATSYSLTIPANDIYNVVEFPTPLTIQGGKQSYGLAITAAGTGAANLGGEIHIS